MNDRFAVLVDGVFMKKTFGSSAKPLDGERVRKFLEWLTAHETLKAISLYRAYFYDASPLDT